MSQSIKGAKHGLSHTREYRAWVDMRRRCYYLKHKWFPSYGGRGISICSEWYWSFERFYADMGPKPGPNYSLERLDNNGDYTPTNCTWATRSEQQHNKREYKLRVDGRLLTFNGITHNLRGWARITGIKYSTLNSRHYAGLPAEEILDKNRRVSPATRRP